MTTGRRLLVLLALAAGCTRGSGDDSSAAGGGADPAAAGPAGPADAGIVRPAGPRLELGPCQGSGALFEERLRPQQLIAAIQSGGAVRPRPPRPSTQGLAAADAALRGRLQELRRCIRPGAVGVGVISLSFDEQGAVHRARSDARDPALSACLDAAVRPAPTVPPGPVDRAVCPLAFGRLAIERLPAVSITGDAVLLDGQPIARLPLAGSASLRPLQDRLQARADDGGPRRTSGMVSPLNGRQYVTVRPAPATPSALLEQVLGSIQAVNAESILMVEERGAWVPLVAEDLPRPPFDVYLPGVTHGPVLSLLVGRVDITIGSGVLGETTTIVGRSGPDLRALADDLARTWAAPPFTPPPEYRRAVEIAGDKVDYAALAAVIRIAAAAGFTDWELTTPTLIMEVLKP